MASKRLMYFQLRYFVHVNTVKSSEHTFSLKSTFEETVGFEYE